MSKWFLVITMLVVGCNSKTPAQVVSYDLSNITNVNIYGTHKNHKFSHSLASTLEQTGLVGSNLVHKLQAFKTRQAETSSFRGSFLLASGSIQGSSESIRTLTFAVQVGEEIVMATLPLERIVLIADTTKTVPEMSFQFRLAWSEMIKLGLTNGGYLNDRELKKVIGFIRSKGNFIKHFTQTATIRLHPDHMPTSYELTL